MPVTKQSLEEARKKQEQAVRRAAGWKGLSKVFIDKVKEELRKRAANRGISKLAEQEAAARKEFVAAPAQQRQEYVGVTPGVRQELIASRRGDLFAELAKIEDLRRAREATIQDIIGAGARGVEAQAAIAGTQAAGAQQYYQNLFNEYQMQIAQEQFAREQALKERAQAALEAYRNAQLGLEAITSQPTPQERLQALMWQFRDQVTGSGEPGKMSREDFAAYAHSQIPELGEDEIRQIAWQYPAWPETRGALPVSTGNKLAGYIGLLRDMTAIKKKLEGKSFLSPTTGPLARFLGSWGPGGQARTDIANLEANIKHGIYGAALTPTEVAQAKTWIPLASAQESTNVQRLTSQINAKRNEALALLMSAGYSEEAASRLIDEMIGQDEYEVVGVVP